MEQSSRRPLREFATSWARTSITSPSSAPMNALAVVCWERRVTAGVQLHTAVDAYDAACIQPGEEVVVVRQRQMPSGVTQPTTTATVWQRANRRLSNEAIS
jgi:hypothetical protein